MRLFGIISPRFFAQSHFFVVSLPPPPTLRHALESFDSLNLVPPREVSSYVLIGAVLLIKQLFPDFPFFFSSLVSRKIGKKMMFPKNCISNRGQHIRKASHSSIFLKRKKNEKSVNNVQKKKARNEESGASGILGEKRPSLIFDKNGP